MICECILVQISTHAHASTHTHTHTPTHTCAYTHSTRTRHHTHMRIHAQHAHMHAHTHAHKHTHTRKHLTYIHAWHNTPLQKEKNNNYDWLLIIFSNFQYYHFFLPNGWRVVYWGCGDREIRIATRIIEIHLCVFWHALNAESQNGKRIEYTFKRGVRMVVCLCFSRLMSV